jgi:general secretion pathway protein G
MKNRQGAFTLLEIMLVVAIIGVLLAAAIYRLAPTLGWAQGTRTGADIQTIRTVLLAYNGKNGSYPTTEQGLDVLVPRLMDKLPKDPWGSPYVYRCPGKTNPTSYDLFSAGMDRIPDTADDDWGN